MLPHLDRWNGCTFPYFSHQEKLKTLDITYKTNIYKYEYIFI